MTAAMLLLGIALVLAASGIWLAYQARKKAQVELILQRLGQADQQTANPSFYHRYLSKLFVRAGLPVNDTLIRAIAVGWALLLVLSLMLGGWLILLMVLISSLLLMRGFLSWRYHKRLARMGQQLAPFMDHAIRSLQTGRTLTDAISSASLQASPPLADALAPMVRNVQLGVPLADAVKDVALLYQQSEMQILALGLEVNDRYGGSAVDLMNNLITLINERDQAARQLRAMTGETRVTAVVLAILPAAVAGYMMVINPTYIGGMWADADGKKMLLCAFALQVMGCVLLWRMLRSIR